MYIRTVPSTAKFEDEIVSKILKTQNLVRRKLTLYYFTLKHSQRIFTDLTKQYFGIRSKDYICLLPMKHLQFLVNCVVIFSLSLIFKNPCMKRSFPLVKPNIENVCKTGISVTISNSAKCKCEIMSNS